MKLLSKEKTVARLLCQKSLEWFVRYYFKARFGTKFIVADHHKAIFQALEKVMAGQTKRLIINIPPRYGKTEIAVLGFIAHSLAINPKARFIHLSYANSLVLDNSAKIRDLVNMAEFQEFFPIEIKADTNSKQMWYTTDGGGLYAAPAGGQVTGFGAGIITSGSSELAKIIGQKANFGGAIIIDDPLKPDDAESDPRRELINERFDNTIRSRVNHRDVPIIIIMQRLHPNDLCGYLIDKEASEWEVLSMPALTENEGKEKALWPFKHTVEELKKIRSQNATVFERQYLQNPKPKEGLMYNNLQTYKELPDGRVEAYIDTADTGSDYLCSITYVVSGGHAYITDVIYTQEAMETTEIKVAKQFRIFGVKLAYIESNNGGRGFGRNVKRLLDEFGTKTAIKQFHQTQNKASRIFNESANVEHYIRFPEGWQSKFPKFAQDVTRYMKAGTNKHDDGPDVLTGIVEKSLNKPKFIFE